jgi:cytochrome oxidase Cu insertion factor (SCO1/SenC/PrrC family)
VVDAAKYALAGEPTIEVRLADGNESDTFKLPVKQTLTFLFFQYTGCTKNGASHDPTLKCKQKL